jgi:hypothetical protein
MRLLTVITTLLLLSACAIGSTTTERPALNLPAIGPDGTFWDAANVAEREKPESFQFLLSPRFIHRALLPLDTLPEISTQQELDALRVRLDRQLAEAAEEAEVDLDLKIGQMLDAYMEELRRLLNDRFIEVGEPEYDIQFRDEFGRASGPNRAELKVSLYPKTSKPDGFEPEVIRVSFLQDGYRWLIEGFEPDNLRGAFDLAR